jgi:hypothetical protein
MSTLAYVVLIGQSMTTLVPACHRPKLIRTARLGPVVVETAGPAPLPQWRGDAP